MLLYNHLTELTALQVLIAVGYGAVVAGLLLRGRKPTGTKGWALAGTLGLVLSVLSTIFVIGRHSGETYVEKFGWPLQFYEVTRGVFPDSSPAVPFEFLFRAPRFLANAFYWSFFPLAVLLWVRDAGSDRSRRALVLSLPIGLFLVAAIFGGVNARHSRLSKIDMMPTVSESAFQFRFRYGVGAKNELDTFENTFTYDMIVDPSITIPLVLTAEEREAVREKIWELGALEKPERADNGVYVMVSPCESYELLVEENGKREEISWDCEQEQNGNNDALDALGTYVRSVLESKQAYQDLPEPRGGYL